MIEYWQLSGDGEGRVLRRLVGLFVGLLCALLLLASCTEHIDSACSSRGLGGPPTVSTGPVIISTDHSVYAPSDTIIVTITNNLETTLHVRSAPGCPTLLLIRQSNHDWQAIDLCRNTEAAPLVFAYSIPAHAATADGLPSSGRPVTLSDGTYRVGVSYSDRKPNADVRVPQTATVQAWSADFQVCTCRSC